MSSSSSLLHRLSRLLHAFPSIAADLPSLQIISVKEALTLEEERALHGFLCQLMVDSRYTYAIAEHFRPILLQLASQLIEHKFASPITASPGILADLISAALSRLLPLQPKLLDITIRHLEKSPPILDRAVSIGSSPLKSEDDRSRLREVTRTAYRLLQVAPFEFAKRWDWAPFFSLCDHHVDAEVQWCAARCLSILTHMQDASERQWNRVMSGGLSEEERYVRQENDLDEIEREQQKIMSTLSNGSIDASEEDIIDFEDLTIQERQQTEPQLVQPRDEQYADCFGIKLPFNQSSTSSSSSEHLSKVVYTPTTISNMTSLATALSQQLQEQQQEHASSSSFAILLEGVAGSGKTTLMDDLSRITGNTDMIKVNLDDSFDSKDLLGTYICGDVPGEFKWQPGALAKAVTEGRWILIEDLDLAPFDVVSVIIPLVESGRLFLPSRDEVLTAARGFHLFATQSLLDSSSGPRKHRVLPMSNLWTRVLLDPLPASELSQLLEQRFANLGPVVPKLMQTLEFIQKKTSSGSSAASSSSSAASSSSASDMETPEEISAVHQQSSIHVSKYLGRNYSLRDLLRWCERVSRLHSLDINLSAGRATEATMELIFMEALDVFCGGIPNYEASISIAFQLARCLNIHPDRVQHFYTSHRPLVQCSGEGLTVGRVVLPVADGDKTREIIGSGSRFAQTKHSLKLMEKIAVCVTMKEPVLLTGETGVGKTTIVQHLAELMGKKLLVHNLNQQSDSSDFIGGFRPVELKLLAASLRQRFENVFERTFSVRGNHKFMEALQTKFIARDWTGFIDMMRLGMRKALGKLDEKMKKRQEREEREAGEGERREIANDSEAAEKKQKPRKKQKSSAAAASAAQQEGEDEAANDDEDEQGGRSTGSGSKKLNGLYQSWGKFGTKLLQFERQYKQVKNSFAFQFQEGALVRALREGHWILLDEVNLASTETLERLQGLLEGEFGSISITERGDTEPIKRHPEFRLFAAMNPPTDVGKKDLPPAMRSRFSEFHVAETTDRDDLMVIVANYLRGIDPMPSIADIVDFYLDARKHAVVDLADGANQRPHYSLRTLVRALDYTRTTLSIYGTRRALYEGIAMSFLTQLGRSSYAIMEGLIRRHILKGMYGGDDKQTARELSKAPAQPGPNYQQFEHFWLESGALPPKNPERYIQTPSVRDHLKNLARVILANKYPVLLQGPTSAGKTSMVEYLAQRTGHRFVRINNHESTDLQEYLGTYVTDAEGNLVFTEGVLVEAVRNGYWIVLDELNLAPTEILEALNRLLDDNRELLIPETQEVIRPHPHFHLFATQNPPGAYGGRKVLSRAFRNRFLELHVDDIPGDELEEILSKRCQIPLSYAQKLVLVMRDLQRVRQGSKVFAGKAGFLTPRDLFRWAERRSSSYLELAEAGYQILAEKLRRDDEKQVVQEVIERHLKVKINLSKMYEPSAMPEFNVLSSLISADANSPFHGLVWTYTMKRLFTLVGQCLRFKEPVLLVGETGCGKTSVCQVFSYLLQQHLHILNCHQHTETSDFLGGLRPVRGREDIAQRLYAAYSRFVSSCKSFMAAAHQALQAQIADSDAMDESSGSSSASAAADEMEADEESVFNSPISEIMAEFESRSSQATTLLSRLLEVQKAKLQQEEVEAAQSSSAPASKKSKKKDEAAKKNQSPNVLTNASLQALADHMASTRAEVAELYGKYKALFVWYDGPLVQAMRTGDLLLIDEISLAEDAVLERLNSVLEPGRLLVLPENGSASVEEIIAEDKFRIFATMNPGGDFGKKELSPALRNRFTEIYVPALSVSEDLRSIIEQRFSSQALRDSLASRMVRFVEYLRSDHKGKKTLSVRDVLSWVDFTQIAATKLGMSPPEAYLHGVEVVLLGGVGIGTGMSEEAARQMKSSCYRFLAGQFTAEEQSQLGVHLDPAMMTSAAVAAKPSSGPLVPEGMFGAHPFFIPRGQESSPLAVGYTFEAPTTSRNVGKLLRAMQLSKPLLLEGSPGVGKTSLVNALALMSGHRVVRINLSEQTDMMDLLGSDLPATDGSAKKPKKVHELTAAEDDESKDSSSNAASSEGRFKWSDGIFLRALKAGDWVLLDELNLASQSVLEGLNSVLDHRGEIYIPELDQTFTCPPTFRLFACQNPLQQGGGRKGLPKSFLNRFTQVYVEELDASDLLFIAHTMYPSIPADTLRVMIEFNTRMHKATMVENKFGRKGAPWEFNLRDVFRWCDLMLLSASASPESLLTPDDHVDSIYVQRMRTPEDRRQVGLVFASVFGRPLPSSSSSADIQYEITPTYVCFNRAHGGARIALPRRQPRDRDNTFSRAVTPRDPDSEPLLLHHLLRPLQTLSKCVAANMMTILSGPSSSGKSSAVRLLASLTGNTLKSFSMTGSADTSELLGGFEQIDVAQKCSKAVEAARELLDRVTEICTQVMCEVSGDKQKESCQLLLDQLQSLYSSWTLLVSASSSCSSSSSSSTQADTEARLERVISVVEQVNAFLISYQASLSSFGLPSTPSQVIHQIREAIDFLRIGAKGRFEWRDGTLVRALERGEWVMIENVNFCNPTVLDRLNSLLEPSGVLVVNERGTIDGEAKIVRPHPQFRLFLLMDPKFGEISRAMRNRGVEMFMSPIPIPSRDALILLAGRCGFQNMPLAALLADFHGQLCNQVLRTQFHVSEDDRPSIRELLRCANVSLDLSRTGAAPSFSRAVWQAIHQVYIRNLLTKPQRAAALKLAHTLFFEASASSAEQQVLSLPSANDWSAMESHSSNLGGSTYFPLSSRLIASSFQVVHRSLECSVSRHLAFLVDLCQRASLGGQAAISSMVKRYHSTLADDVSARAAVALESSPQAGSMQSASSEEMFAVLLRTATHYAVESTSVQERSLRTLALQRAATTPAAGANQFSLERRLAVVAEAFYAVEAHPLFALSPSAALSRLLLHIVFQLLEEKHNLLTQLPHAAGASLLQVSTAAHEDSRLRAEVQEPFVLYLAPLLHALNDCIDVILSAPESIAVLTTSEDKDFHIQALSTFVSRRNVFAKYLRLNTTVTEEFYVLWNRVRKSSAIPFFVALLSSSPAFARLASLFDSLNQSLSSSSSGISSGAKNRLWRRGGHPAILRTHGLRNLQRQFEAHVKQCSGTDAEKAQHIKTAEHDSDEEKIRKHAQLLSEAAFRKTLSRDVDLRNMLVQGMATLRFANTQADPSIGEKLAARILVAVEKKIAVIRSNVEADARAADPEKALVMAFERAFAALEAAPADNSTLLDLVNSNMKPESKEKNPGTESSKNNLHAAALADVFAARLESSILGDLLRLMRLLEANSGDDNVTLDLQSRLRHDVREFCDFCLAHSSRALTHLIPYQTLVWMLDTSSSSASSSAPSSSLKQVSVPYNTSSSAANLRQALPSLYSEAAFAFQSFVNHNPLLAVNLSSIPSEENDAYLIQAARHGASTTRLFESYQTTYAVSMLRGWRMTPLLSRTTDAETIVEIIRHLALQPTPVAAQSIAKQDSCLLRLALAQTLSPFESSSATLPDAISALFNTDVASINGEHAQLIAGAVASSTDARLAQSAARYMPSLLANLCASTAPATRVYKSGNEDEYIHSLRTLASRGAGWAALGGLRFSLLSPTQPLDPSRKFSVELAHVCRHLDDLMLEMGARLDIESFLSGSSSAANSSSCSDEMNFIMKERQVLAQTAASLVKSVVPRPEGSQFMELFREIHSFASDLLHDERYLAMVKAFGAEKTSGITVTSTMLQQERLWQGTASSFITRLMQTYAGYEDVTQPIAVAVLQCKYGLRMAARSAAIQRLWTPVLCQRLRAARSLLTFPRAPASMDVDAITAVASSDNDSQLEDTASAKTTVTLLRVCAEQLSADILSRGYAQGEDLSHIRDIMSAFADFFARAQESEKKKKEQQDSLYKKRKERTVEILSDEQVNELDYLQEFPTFMDEFSDLQTAEDDMMKADDGSIKPIVDPETARLLQERKAEQASKIITDDDILRMSRVHQSVMALLSSKESSSVTFDSENAFAESFEAAAMVLVPEAGEHSNPEEEKDLFMAHHLDGRADISLGLLRYATSAAAHLYERPTFRSGVAAPQPKKKVSISSSAPYDIYHDPNYAEVQLAFEPVRSLATRVSELLDQFPEHAILLQILKLCERVLQLPISSPVMKYLAGLELLLRRSQEWESYAASFVSIKEQLRTLSELILRWRRLELESWPNMMRSRELTSQAKAQRWWFHLFRIISSPDLVPKEATAPAVRRRNGNADVALTVLDIFVQDFFASMNDFVETSTFGEFENRLSLLRSFADHIEFLELGKDQEQSMDMDAGDEQQFQLQQQARAKMRTILLNIASYFEQFRGRHQERYIGMREPIEKQMRDFVKLCRWDDFNFYSLKASTDRSHRKVSKFLRNFQQILDMPARELWMQDTAANAQIPVTRDARAAAMVVKISYFTNPDDLIIITPAAAKLISPPEPEEEEAEPELAEDDKKSKKNKKKSQKGKGKKQTSKRTKKKKAKKPVDLVALAASHPQPADVYYDIISNIRRFLVSNASAAPFSALSANAFTPSPLLQTLFQLDDAALRRNRLPQLCKRLDAICRKDVLDGSQLQTSELATEAAEELATAIIQRAAQLQEKQKVKLAKKKALTDLLRALDNMGFPRSRAAQLQLESIQVLFEKEPLHPLSSAATTNTKAAGGDVAASIQSTMFDLSSALTAKSNEYYHRSIFGIQRLRVASQMPNKDLSGREIQRGLLFCENLLSVVAEQRQSLNQVSEAHTTVCQSNAFLAALSAVPTSENKPFFYASHFAVPLLKSLILALDKLQTCLAQLAALQESLRVRLTSSTPSLASSLSAAERVMSSARSSVTASLNSLKALGFEQRPEFLPFDCALMTATLPHVSAVSTCVAQVEHWLSLSSEYMPSSESLAQYCQDALSISSKFLSITTKPIVAEQQQHQPGGNDEIKHSVLQESVSTFTTLYDDVLSQLLLAVQSFHQAKSKESAAEQNQNDVDVDDESGEAGEQPEGEAEGDEEEDNSFVEVKVSEPIDFYRRLPSTLRLSPLSSALTQLLSHVSKLAEVSSSMSPSSLAIDVTNTVAVLLSRLAPLLSIFETSVRCTQLHLSSFHKSLSKLGIVMQNLFIDLFRRGFCVTPDEEESENNGEEEQGPMESGTGMGEGEGEKDISDEIEDENELLNADDVKKPGDEKGENQDKKDNKSIAEDAPGVETEADLDGEMFDVEKKKKGEDDDDDDNDDDGEDEEDEMDRQMGDVDRKNEEKVDEKLWDGDEEDQDLLDKEEDNDDSPLDNNGKQESEIRAKEDDDKNPNRSKDKKDKEKAKNKPNQAESDDEDDADDDFSDQDDARSEESEIGTGGDQDRQNEVRDERDTEFEVPDNLNLEDNDKMDEDDDDLPDSEGEEEANKDGMDEDEDEVEAPADAKLKNEKERDPSSKDGDDEDDDANHDDKAEKEKGGEEGEGEDADKDKGEENDPDAMDVDQKEGDEEKDDEKNKDDETKEDENAEKDQQQQPEAEEEKEADVKTRGLNAEVDEAEAMQDEAVDGDENKEGEENEEQQPEADAEADETTSYQKDLKETPFGVQKSAVGDASQIANADPNQSTGKESQNRQEKDEKEEEGTASAQESAPDADKGQSLRRGRPEGLQSQQDKTKQPKQKKEDNNRFDANPFRSMPDAVKQWRQKLEMIDKEEEDMLRQQNKAESEDKKKESKNAQEEEDDDDVMGANDQQQDEQLDGEFEFVEEGEESKDDKEALGPALEQQAQQMEERAPDLEAPKLEDQQQQQDEQGKKKQNQKDKAQSAIAGKQGDEEEDETEEAKKKKAEEALKKKRERDLRGRKEDDEDMQDEEDDEEAIPEETAEEAAERKRFEEAELMKWLLSEADRQEQPEDEPEESKKKKNDMDQQQDEIDSIRADLSKLKDDKKQQGSSSAANKSKKSAAEGEADDGDEMDEENDDQLVESQQQRVIQELTPEALAKMREELDLQMSEWRSVEGNVERGRELWKKFESVVGPLSQELCEQLRLILEPTLATKLKGDYRTGKRINMKKVIPYIASQFKKDKIWLRRTKPNKRQYQIMLAIDDSESMRNNGAGVMALESLTLLCKAMSQLEVGEMCVASFGDSFKLLHPFDRPFTEDHGADILAHFTFKQKSTNVTQFLETSSQLLEMSKGNGGASSSSSSSPNSSAIEYLQLLFMISDGSIQNRDGLKRIIREALAKKQFVVFILIDNPANAKDSILNLKSVQFVNGKVSTSLYLDGFPFPYYIILRDLHNLPEVLADALRQFFEMASSFEQQ